MIKLRDILKENSKQSYSYGCAMIFLDEHETINKIHDIINVDDLYVEDNSYGIEDEHHVTTLYGLHDDEVTIKEVSDIIQSYTWGTFILHNPSLFLNDKYDVLKFQVSGDNLHKVNSDLRKLPHTTSFPKYNPHATIAYLKKGLGNVYVNVINEMGLNDIKVKPTKGVYSTSDGKKHNIKLNINNVKHT